MSEKTLREILDGTRDTNGYPDGWFTHNCKYLVDGIKCSLDLDEGCEYMTKDRRCYLIVGRLEQYEDLHSLKGSANDA